MNGPGLVMIRRRGCIINNHLILQWDARWSYANTPAGALSTPFNLSHTSKSTPLKFVFMQPKETNKEVKFQNVE